MTHKPFEFKSNPEEVKRDIELSFPQLPDEYRNLPSEYNDQSDEWKLGFHTAIQVAYKRMREIDGSAVTALYEALERETNARP